jgi:hypothetical protein
MSRARPPTRVGIKEAPVCIVAGAFTLLASYQQTVQFYADIDWLISQWPNLIIACGATFYSPVASEYSVPSIRLAVRGESEHDRRMIAVGLLFVRILCDCFKSRRRLKAEILILRHQLNVLWQRAPRRGLHLRWVDRVLFIWLYRRCPRILDAITIVRPETVVRWHRRGFAAYWRWKSRSPGGRPPIAKEVRDLIRRMSLENPLWGATKIHGELLKLGIDVAQSTVSIYYGAPAGSTIAISLWCRPLPFSIYSHFLF